MKVRVIYAELLYYIIVLKKFYCDNFSDKNIDTSMKKKEKLKHSVPVQTQII